jgi:hypothetical protein
MLKNQEALIRLKNIKKIRENRNKRIIGKFKLENKRSVFEHLQILFNLKMPDMLYNESFLFRLRESIRENMTGWHRNLMWCPSQVEKRYQYKGYEVIAYLRWRWNDPWTGNFILENNERSLWSEEIFSKYNFNDQTDIRTLEKKMEELYRYYFIDKKEKLKLERTKWVEKQSQV